MAFSSDSSTPPPIPSATIFVSDPPDTRLFNAVASDCNHNAIDYLKRIIIAMRQLC